MAKIKTLFIDVGGVILTNGWDINSRKLAAKTFHLDFEEMDKRHRMTFDTYEVGKLSLKDYLDRIVFYEKRKFSRAQFEKFMFSQSQAYPEMIKLIQQVKAKHRLKVVVVSNEGKELTTYRIKKFKLDSFIDIFVASSFVHLRKPDVDIYHLALDVSQARPDEVLYIEDREMFVQVAEGLGIHGLHHVDFETTKRKLAKL